MFVFYKEKMTLILSLLMLFLDGIIVYFIPSYFNKLHYFYPMLSITFLPFMFHGNYQDYYKMCFVFGLLYDLFYSNIFLFNALVFLMLGKIDSKMLKFLPSSLFTYLLLVLINILIYDGISFFLMMITHYQEVSFNDYVYKISHSLLLNFLSAFVCYFWYRKSFLKHKMYW